jgi:glycosyltransferase involved in cell wall biosynthesis
VVGGVENVLADHVRLMARAGYATSIVAGRGSGASLPEATAVTIIPELDSENPGNREIAQALADRLMPDGFQSLAGRIENVLRLAFESSQIVIAHNVLSMQFNLPLTAALHRLLDQRPGWRLVSWTHDVSRFVRPSSGAPQRAGHPWHLLRRFRPEVTYVAVSEERRHHLAEALGCSPEAIHVIPNGVDAGTLLGWSETGRELIEAFGLLDADLALLMPVRVTRAKNIEFALEVTAGLKALGLDPRLVVSGPPDPHAADGLSYYRGLLALRDDLGLQGQAFFVYEGTARLGSPCEIAAAVVGELYRACDIVFMPSHREGFGLPVLEAGLAFRPIFVTPVPALELLGPSDVQRIEPGEPAGMLAERLAAWASQDAALRLRRRVRQGFTWPALFRSRIEPLLAEVLRRSPEPGA